MAPPDDVLPPEPHVHVHDRQPDPQSVDPPAREALVRLNDFHEVYPRPTDHQAQHQANRCMTCGAAFCQPHSGYTDAQGQPTGCPINNRIPEWNELVKRGRWRDAYDRLSLTNNFPEFTSRVCPAPCQDACIVGLNDVPVGIKTIERAIIDHAFERGWVQPRQPASRSGRHIAVVGSGPAGLTAADELNRRGHRVTVYERSDLPGGLLTYGVPNMKLDKGVVARRVNLLEHAGIEFICHTAVGTDLDPGQLVREHDAILLATGALSPRELDLPGRSLGGVVQAMDYLEQATRHLVQNQPGAINARGLDVVVIGAGDTGADCIGTALRQRCRSVINITRRPQPASYREPAQPWPGVARTYRLDYAHKEGKARDGRDPRDFEVQPLAFIPDPTGHAVAGIRVRRLGTGVVETIPARLVILAAGFTGHDSDHLLEPLGITSTRGRINASPDGQAQPKVFAAGDLRQGPSLVVSAIAEGRAVARHIHHGLSASQAVGAWSAGSP